MTALVAAIVIVGGCGLIGSVVTTTTGLQHAGFSSVKVGLNAVASGRNAVDVSVTVDATPSERAAETAARVVWNDLHEHFDELDLTVHGRGPALARHYRFGDLVTLFGPRNPAWDRTSVTSSVRNLGFGVTIGLAAVAALVVVIILLVVRRRRRRGPPPPWPGFAATGPGPPPPWPGSPPSGPGEGAPPPAPGWGHPPPPRGSTPGPSGGPESGPWGAPAPPD